jgi:opacity protein-like surface antigen
MVDLRAFALTAVAVVALSSAASAADLLPPPPQVEPPPPAFIDAGGWYLRGDLGIGFNNTNNGATDSPSPLGGYGPGQASDNWYNAALSEAALFDLGVGYQVNRWFRVDVTGELRGGSSFSGLEVLNVTGGAHAGYQAADFYSGHVSSVLSMANAYVDLGTWYGLTPYVGAGLGVAFNNFYGATDNGVITQPGGATSPSGGYFGNNTHTDLAWALMTGFDMDITHNLKLEVGYRYLNYGKIQSGASHCLGGCQDFTIASKNLSSNDVRIGLRYYFDAEAPPPPDVPLVRKY